jgi:hypothetical protein
MMIAVFMGVCARVGARQESAVLHQAIKRKYGGRVQHQSSAATKRATMTMTMAMAMTKAMAMTTVTKTVTVTAHIIKSNPRQLAMLRSNAGTQARLQAGRHVRTTCAHEHTHAHTHTRTRAPKRTCMLLAFSHAAFVDFRMRTRAIVTPTSA